MTDNSRNDRRRNFDGRINTLGTGTNGVSRRDAGSVGSRQDERDDDDHDDEELSADAPLADEEGREHEESDDDSDAETDDERDAEADEADSEEDDAEADTATRANGVTPEADVSLDEDDEVETEAPASPHETRSEVVDERASLEVELDPFVRAYAARRAGESDESLDEYIVGSVKGYLAGLLGGDVSSPGTLEREIDVESDPIFGGLLEAIGGEDKTVEAVVIEAVAEAYDVPVDEETLVVAGLRDHEALLNGVVANGSNDLGDVSEVVQAAVETRLVEEPA